MMHRLAQILLFSLAVSQLGAAETNLRTATTPSYSSSHQRRDLSVSGFWYTLLNLLHVPCPPHHTDDHPLGHCAHPSHKPHPKKKSSSHSSSSHSSSSSSHSSSSWGGDSYGSKTSSGWTGDSQTSATVASNAWTSGWTNEAEAQDTSSGNGAFWGIGTMLVALVGTIAFMVNKRRNRSVGEDSSDAYVEADGIQFSRMASVATSLSRGVRSKLIKTDVDEQVSSYHAPV